MVQSNYSDRELSSMYQSYPPLSPAENLPTMYELPSEDPEEPGLPDEFHDLQPQLLRETFCPPDYLASEIFTAGDLNLYYDASNPLRYKRPDWFAVLGVPRLYAGKDMRLSYVIWQEGVVPSIVVELLSPGTEKEDLGQTVREVNQPPTKWEVYERILQVPYYVIFDRYSDRLLAYQLMGGNYSEVPFVDGKLWLPILGLGLGCWQGSYQGIERLWLRWYDAAGSWILMEEERAEQQRDRAQQAEDRAERLAARLRALGIETDGE